MISKNKIKFIRSLDSKKERQESGRFVAEGEKIVGELLSSTLKIDFIAASEGWIAQNTQLLKGTKTEIVSVNDDEMKRISFLKTPSSVLAVVQTPNHDLNINELSGKLSLLLDTVQDPGNLGTILRICDWFGIEHVICTRETADMFNPKVVQSTMGAVCRIKVYYENFETLLPKIEKLGLPIYGTLLDGENMYKKELQPTGFIMMGNESTGINPQWQKYINQKLFIPYFPENEKRSESLNVAIATALVCAEFRRRS